MRPILISFFLFFIIATFTVAQELEHDILEESADAKRSQSTSTISCCNIMRHVQECKNQLICQLCQFLNEIANSFSNSIQNYLPTYLYWCISNFFYQISGEVCNLVPYWYCYSGPWYYYASDAKNSTLGAAHIMKK